MTLTLGSIALSDGSRSQPWRLASSGGRREAETVALIRSDAPGVYDRRNRSFSDAVELEREWASPALAAGGAASLQESLLAAAPAALAYGSSARGTAVCTRCDFELSGCSALFRITLEGTFPAPSA